MLCHRGLDAPGLYRKSPLANKREGPRPGLAISRVAHPEDVPVDRPLIVMPLTASEGLDVPPEPRDPPVLDRAVNLSRDVRQIESRLEPGRLAFQYGQLPYAALIDPNRPGLECIGFADGT